MRHRTSALPRSALSASARRAFEAALHAADKGAARASVRDVEVAALKDAEQRWKFALEGAAQGVWDWDLPSHKVYYSPRYKAMLGYREEEFGSSEKDWSDRIHPDDQAGTLAAVAQHFRGETPIYDIVFRMRRKDGSYAWIESRGMIVERATDGRPRRVIGTHTDITERKHNEDALRKLTDHLEAQVAERTAQLRAASAAKSEFLAHMSHEIRTPMNAVISLTQLMKHESLTPEQGEIIRTIEQAGQSLLRIINEILDFSKIEAGQLQLEQKPVDLHTVMKRMAKLFRESAEAKGVSLSVICPASMRHAILGDALRLEQVIINLLSNAIKFTERGNVVLRAIVKEEGANDVLLRFEVSDNGIGISPDAIATLFRPFIQANHGIARRFGGTGLGLAICKHLVELMGGQIGVDSTPGEGSTFWFEIPFPWADGDEAAVECLAQAHTQEPRLSGMHVLAVDDNQMNLYVVEKILRKEGAIVALAADGQQALKILQANPMAIDVVLMDVQMPVMDGLAATRAIRSDPALSRIPVIALTAGVLAEEQEQALAAGVNGFLPKPLDRTQMIGMLSPFLPIESSPE